MSQNQKGRRREEKGRRTGRGAFPSKQILTSVVVPSQSTTPLQSTPSPSSRPPSQSHPPVAKVPLTIGTQRSLTVNIPKDPSSTPVVLIKEAKFPRRVVKEKAEKEPPKATIRKKKTSVTRSISLETKTSSENEGRLGSKNERKKRRSSPDSTDNISEGSREPSENDEKTPRKFNPELASKFFKHIQESRRAKRRSADASLEKMPESSQLNVSIRSMRSKLRKTPKPSLETDMFKPNGDPFWVVSDRPPDECEKNENGEPITNSELALTLAQDGLELEEKDWFELTKSYMNFELPKGIRLPDYHKFDSLAPLEKLKDMNLYLSEKTIAYNTVQNLVELSEDAIKRFAMRREGNIGRVRSVIVQDTAEKATNTPTASIPAAPARPSREKFQLSTCIISSVNFNTQVINVQYERQNSILSIQNYRKMMSRMYSMEQTTQMESREKI
ncbi:hypothetical protein GCK72_001809 [Caenorhabditis remanei]|uniref:Uncharacterized protein n=1 Tax=Caenorhabditis remanei TaxID=31234 RepID=A0A6A5HW28_CAERE|nr:hypothetical protein GCK72_001809 [Caenorhabditis remanei]KAF1769992.1 hypothetical protein GCK72_001809 [Caenorhabditis remanei]